jgi:hypothetical protein
MAELKFRQLVGLRVVALRGTTNNDRRIKKVPLTYVLFDDEKTYLEFTEQDPHSYHDCSSSARNIAIYQDAERWTVLMTNNNYADSTEDFYYSPY